MKPKAVDLFCGAGGASFGYWQAGFDLTGIDVAPQPNYPFRFVQADALEFFAEHGDEYEVAFASPPCQRYANVTSWRGDQADHPDLVASTRDLLLAAGLPYVIENVDKAPLRADFMLCGSMFDLPIRRHRYFETNWADLHLTAPCQHRPSDLAFEHKQERAYADAMGCTWMTSKEARQAVPPSYTRFIGQALLSHLSHTSKAAA